MSIPEMKDECRKNLNRYTLRAFSFIAATERPFILDAGCGTGVPALALCESCNGHVYGVDPDRQSLELFRKKINDLELGDRITLINSSILEPFLFDFKFDIILAEGLLNVIGFEKGLHVLSRLRKCSVYSVGLIL